MTSTMALLESSAKAAAAKTDDLIGHSPKLAGILLSRRIEGKP